MESKVDDTVQSSKDETETHAIYKVEKGSMRKNN